MKIIRSGSLPSVQGPEARFTGSVRIDAPFRATEPAKSVARPSPLNPAHVPPGIRILLDKR